MTIAISSRGGGQQVWARASSSAAASTIATTKILPLAFSPLKWRPSKQPPQKRPQQQQQQVQQPQPKRLVLVGGGHAHVQVIKALNKASRPKNLHVTLIDVQSSASYSGMVPGCISGLYQPDDTLLRLDPLAKWAGIEFVHDRVMDIDVERNLITLHGDPKTPIPFDAVSVDIGSTSRGLLETKGAKKYCIATRPISDLVQHLDQATEELKKRPQPVDVVVIGGGAAGIELSMSVMGRWKALLGKENIRMTVLDSNSQLLPNETPANRDALLRILSDRGIDIRYDCVVEEVQKGSARFTNGEEIPFSHCLWATGAGAHDLAFRMQEKGLALSKHGWIRVDEHLQSLSHPQIFAAGDCCTMEGLANGSPPKAGVYAVRSGPILIKNLTRFLGDNKPQQQPLEAYRPQDDFLKLVVCGDGTALGFRFGISIHGKWVFQIKDAIDNSFMDLFKAENLPELVEGQPYDGSQYDATKDPRPSPKDPYEAAALLQRTDDDVDYKEAWNVLRDMSEDEEYRDKVLLAHSMSASQLALVA